jgi:hypothetical protein
MNLIRFDDENVFDSQNPHVNAVDRTNKIHNGSLWSKSYRDSSHDHTVLEEEMK